MFGKILNLSILDKALLISLAIILVLGILFFFLAGLHRVPKNHAIVMEKAKQFYCIYDKGIHFLMPIAYQRVGIYCIAPQVRKYVANNGNHIDITYQVIDVQKYHYNYISFEELMQRIEKENTDITIDVLQSKFALYGLKFISAKQSLN